MNGERLKGRRILVLGAESDLGQAIASALAEEGAAIAVVASSANAADAFAVQRLSRKLSRPGVRSVGQAIDAGNEMAARVMVRQVGKELGGLDAAVLAVEGQALELGLRFAARETSRKGKHGLLIALAGAGPVPSDDVASRAEVRNISPEGKSIEKLAAEVVEALRATPIPEERN